MNKKSKQSIVDFINLVYTKPPEGAFYNTAEEENNTTNFEYLLSVIKLNITILDRWFSHMSLNKYSKDPDEEELNKKHLHHAFESPLAPPFVDFNIPDYIKVPEEYGSRTYLDYLYGDVNSVELMTNFFYDKMDHEEFIYYIITEAFGEIYDNEKRYHLVLSGYTEENVWDWIDNNYENEITIRLIRRLVTMHIIDSFRVK